MYMYRYVDLVRNVIYGLNFKSKCSRDGRNIEMDATGEGRKLILDHDHMMEKGNLYIYIYS